MDMQIIFGSQFTILFLFFPGTNDNLHSTDTTAKKSLMVFFHGFTGTPVEVSSLFEYNIMGKLLLKISALNYFAVLFLVLTIKPVNSFRISERIILFSANGYYSISNFVEKFSQRS